MQNLKFLEKLGEEIKDYKHWHLKVDEKGYCIDGPNGRYRNVGSVEADLRLSPITTIVNVLKEETYPLVRKKESFNKTWVRNLKGYAFLQYKYAEDATERCPQMSSAEEKLDRIVISLRKFENFFKNVMTNKSEEEKAVDNLLSKFSIEPLKDTVSCGGVIFV